MTVAELIAELQKVENQDAIVRAWEAAWGSWEPITKIDAYLGRVDLRI